MNKNIVPVLIAVAAAVFAAIRIVRRNRRDSDSPYTDTAGARRGTADEGGVSDAVRAMPAAAFGSTAGRETWLVAAREIRERLRGRIFRIGTLILLALIAAAIVVPVLTRGKPHVQQVGLVGSPPGAAQSEIEAQVTADATNTGTTVRFVTEPSVAQARAELGSGRLDLVIVEGQGVRLIVDKPIAAPSTSGSSSLTAPSTTDTFVHAVSLTLGADQAFRAAGLTAGQADRVAHAGPVPITSLQPAAAKSAGTASYLGLVVIFLMLTQYNTWTLAGVAEEKSSRIAEVLLAAIRPGRLVAGKVLGIGLVAFGQAALLGAAAAGLAAAVGSDLLHGTAPAVLASTLIWLVLGYAFSSWVYAAAGSMAERRDQIQGLAFPLMLPSLVGYFFSEAVLGSGASSTLFDVLGYLPPTAPFVMPVLVGLGRVAWWQVAVSALVSILCTIAVARFAVGVYRRSILRTGHRVRLREVFPGRRFPASG
ncbi:MAG TPA: ABC transporter permease [Actinocrinis sp.]|jgi:ABC-2 type transport system permease protein